MVGVLGVDQSCPQNNSSKKEANLPEPTVHLATFLVFV